MPETILQYRRRLGPDYGVHHLFRTGVQTTAKYLAGAASIAYNYYNSKEEPKMAAIKRRLRMRPRRTMRRKIGRSRRRKLYTRKRRTVGKVTGNRAVKRAIKRNSGGPKVSAYKQGNNIRKIYDYINLNSITASTTNPTISTFDARIADFTRIKAEMTLAGNRYHEYRFDKVWYKITPVRGQNIRNATDYTTPSEFYNGMAVWAKQHMVALPVTINEFEIKRTGGFQLIPYDRVKPVFIAMAPFLEKIETDVGDQAGNVFQTNMPLSVGRKWLEYQSTDASNPKFFSMAIYNPLCRSTNANHLPKFNVEIHVCVSIRNRDGLIAED